MFVNFGGKKVSMPTDVICDRCVFGPNSAQTVFVATSIRPASGTRRSAPAVTALRVGPRADANVNENNTARAERQPVARGCHRARPPFLIR